MLSTWQQVAYTEDEEDLEEEPSRPLPKLNAPHSSIRRYAEANRSEIRNVPSCSILSWGHCSTRLHHLSQYFDSLWWLAHQLAHDLSKEVMGIYAGGSTLV